MIQDINHLEDLVKTVKSKQITDRGVLKEKFEKLRKDQKSANQRLADVNLENEKIDVLEAPKWLKDKQSTSVDPQAMTNQNIFQMLMPQGASHLLGMNPMLISLQRTAALQYPGITPRRIGEDPSKSKKCLNCSQLIHRNAPICPFCKTKSVSRNPRRYRREKPNN
uniref:C4H2-type domain-containing protein n=1 Tax=Bursaphelenchus xylophilus TaxID=6326 RepID=A0A1I7SVA9_BURXY